MRHRFKEYCKDYKNIENYDKAKADNFIGWCIHHRLQTWTSDGERREVGISAEELEALGMYYNRPPEELIFLTISHHAALHNRGKHHTEEAKKKISEAKKGKKLSEEHKKNLSEAHKGKHLSAETRKKLSIASKNISDETRKKIGAAHKGKPSGMKGKHHSEEAKRKLGAATKGTRWYNNGKINIRTKECPNGFVSGRISRKK